MLTKIKIKNFKSIMNETTIDLNATGYEILADTNTYNKTLKGALIVGGNASGKSTIIESLRFLLQLLVWQMNVKPTQYICLLPKRKGRMELGYEFAVNNSNIIYNIECEVTGISVEKLEVDGKQVLYRTKTSAEYTNSKEEKISIEKLENNQSALRKIYFDTKFSDNETLKDWFEFLENSVYVNQAHKRAATSKNFSVNYKAYFDESGTKEFNEFLEDSNYGQTVEYTNSYESKNKRVSFSVANNEKDIIFKRTGVDVAIPMEMESEGNQTLVHLLPNIIRVTKEKGMVIIDEFSSAFHNMLEEKILKMFMQNSKNSQMFIVSHSSNLLTNSLMRPDQIYTVDFIGDEGTRVTRVSDAQPREAQNLEKMYLSGVFDGLPNYNK